MVHLNPIHVFDAVFLLSWQAACNPKLKDRRRRQCMPYMHVDWRTDGESL